MWKIGISIQLENVVHTLHGTETILYPDKQNWSLYDNKFEMEYIFKYKKKK